MQQAEPLNCGKFCYDISFRFYIAESCRIKDNQPNKLVSFAVLCAPQR